MPALVCTAKSCVHNKNELCDRGEILVAGETAHTKDETCCSSFKERTGDSMTNSSANGCGCDNIQVACEVCECRYNESKKCQAGSIDIYGEHACQCRETQCNTFECK